MGHILTGVLLGFLLIGMMVAGFDTLGKNMNPDQRIEADSCTDVDQKHCLMIKMVKCDDSDFFVYHGGYCTDLLMKVKNNVQ